MTLKELKKEVQGLSDLFLAMARALRETDQKKSYESFQTSEILRTAAENLQQDPVKAETEGGGSSWWQVGGECHTMIDTKDKFCRECGRKIDWE